MLSVIILTYNSAGFIAACLESVFKQAYTDFEVIVVDNGSKDETTEIICKNYPRVILIRNNSNEGSCRGRNQAIKASRGEWIVTLDCDIILDQEFFLKLIEKIKKIPLDVGIIQSKILTLDSKKIYSCGVYLCWSRRFYDIGYKKKDGKVFEKEKYIFGACSAAAVYKRQMLEEIKDDRGYFDEKFFFLVEDVDLAWRARNVGWKTLFCPELICRHFGNGSGCNLKLRQYLCFRNRYYTIIKNEGMKKYFSKFFPVSCYDVPRWIYLTITNKYLWKDIHLKYRRK